MTIFNVLANLERRFKSGNEVPVESARITRDEWSVLNDFFMNYYVPNKPVGAADSNDTVAI